MKNTYKMIFVIAIFTLFICLSGFTGIDNRQKNNIIHLSDVPSNKEYVQFVDYFDNPQLKVLYNLNDEPEYLVVSSEGQGYAIFNRISGKLLEMSKNDDNPYKSVSKGYFIAPFSYAEGSVSNLAEIESGKVYTLQEKQNIKIFQSSLKQKNIALQLAKNDYIDSSSEEFDFDNTEYCVDALDAEDYTNVAHSESIMEWYEADADFLRNRHGTCVQVALTLLYRYSDLVYGGIIPQLPPQEWINSCSGYTIMDSNGDLQNYSLLNTSSAANTMCNFTKYLAKLSGITNSGTNDNQMLQAVSAYNAEVNSKGCLNINTLTHNQTSAENVEQFVSDGIANKRPTRMSIFSSKGTDSEYHSVIAYGIKIGLNDTFYRVHSGWDNKSSYYISEDYLVLNQNRTAVQLNVASNSNHNLSLGDSVHNCNNINCYANNVSHRAVNNGETHACVCGYSESHTYSCDYILQYEDVHFCEECGAIEEHELQSISNSYHVCDVCDYINVHDFFHLGAYHSCSCGFSGECDVEFWSYLDENENAMLNDHKGECTICKNTVILSHNGCISLGSSGHSINCTDCGLISAQAPHNLIYKSLNSNQHQRKCSHCDYVLSTAPHQFEILAGFFLNCKICGYTKLRPLM